MTYEEKMLVDKWWCNKCKELVMLDLSQGLFCKCGNFINWKSYEMLKSLDNYVPTISDKR